MGAIEQALADIEVLKQHSVVAITGECVAYDFTSNTVDVDVGHSTLKGCVVVGGRNGHSLVTRDLVSARSSARVGERILVLAIGSFAGDKFAFPGASREGAFLNELLAEHDAVPDRDRPLLSVKVGRENLAEPTEDAGERLYDDMFTGMSGGTSKMHVRQRQDMLVQGAVSPAQVREDDTPGTYVETPIPVLNRAALDTDNVVDTVGDVQLQTKYVSTLIRTISVEGEDVPHDPYITELTAEAGSYVVTPFDASSALEWTATLNDEPIAVNYSNDGTFSFTVPTEATATPRILTLAAAVDFTKPTVYSILVRT